MPRDPSLVPSVWRYRRRRFYTPDTWRRLGRLLLAQRDRRFCLRVAWVRLSSLYLRAWWRAAMLLLASDKWPILLAMPERISNATLDLVHLPTTASSRRHLPAQLVQQIPDGPSALLCRS